MRLWTPTRGDPTIYRGIPKVICSSSLLVHPVTAGGTDIASLVRGRNELLPLPLPGFLADAPIITSFVLIAYIYMIWKTFLQSPTFPACRQGRDTSVPTNGATILFSPRATVDTNRFLLDLYASFLLFSGLARRCVAGRCRGLAMLG